MTALPGDTCEVRCVHPEAVQAARERQPEGWCVEQASALLKLMADPTRLKLLSALADAELCVCDLASVVGLSESAISHQLRLLREQRVVASRKAGRVVYYRLQDVHVSTLLENVLAHASEAWSEPPNADKGASHVAQPSL